MLKESHSSVCESASFEAELEDEGGSIDIPKGESLATKSSRLAIFRLLLLSLNAFLVLSMTICDSCSLSTVLACFVLSL